MTDSSGLQPGDGRDTSMYRRTAEGSLEAAPGVRVDYRDQLSSRRWNAAPLENPEVEKTDPRMAVLAIAVLSGVTLLVLLLGYGSGFWG